MMQLIRNVSIVNEGTITVGDVLIDDGRISKIGGSLTPATPGKYHEIDASGMFLFPGCIDDQVHFREPGLTHKADIYTESRAAVAGGITSFMEMPNTIPNALTIPLLENKFDIASQSSVANYSFYLGASNNNIDEVLKADSENICGIKIFMGSSTGNMLVDEPEALERIFSSSPLLIATHCEDEETIKANLAFYKNEYGDKLNASFHPKIRSAEACYLSSSTAVALAKKHNTRLHILHISTAKEIDLFEKNMPVINKRITSEVCIHHLWFDDSDYISKGNLIKWNPAVKTKDDKKALQQALVNDVIDVVATDHAPHTLQEKSQPYLQAPSGGPLVQHALPAMIDFYKEGWISLEHIARKMAHDVADCFRIKDRGYIREGYYADLVLVDLNDTTRVDKSGLLYKCKWSPFEGHTFKSAIKNTWVNGILVYDKGKIVEGTKGMRMQFEKDR
jgi:dihydroorotase